MKSQFIDAMNSANELKNALHSGNNRDISWHHFEFDKAYRKCHEIVGINAGSLKNLIEHRKKDRMSYAYLLKLEQAYGGIYAHINQIDHLIRLFRQMIDENKYNVAAEDCGRIALFFWKCSQIIEKEIVPLLKEDFKEVSNICRMNKAPYCTQAMHATKNLLRIAA